MLAVSVFLPRIIGLPNWLWFVGRCWLFHFPICPLARSLLNKGSSSARLAVSVFLPRYFRFAHFARVRHRIWRFPFASQVYFVPAVSAVGVGVRVLVIGAASHVDGDGESRLIAAACFDYFFYT